MCCGDCVGNVILTLKNIFVRTPAEKTSVEEKKTGTLSGRAVSQSQIGPEGPIDPKEKEIDEIAQAAITAYLEGKDPGPLSDEVKKRVAEGMVEYYAMMIAQKVAISDATTMEQAEKVASVALDAFAKDYVEILDQSQTEKMTEQQKDENKNKVKQALGFAPKDLAVYGLLIRQQIQQYQAQQQAQQDANAPVVPPAVANAPVAATA